MTEPLSITAAVVGITTTAISSIQFLYTTIGNIKDVPTALGNIKSELQAIEPVLQKLLSALETEDSSKILLIDDIKPAVESCNSACTIFKNRLDHWMRHATKHKAFWAEWTDRARIGILEQGTINVFKGRLHDCKSTLLVVLNTSSVLAVARQGSIMQEVKDSMLQSNVSRLDEEKARADRESIALETSLSQLSIRIRDEVNNQETKQSLEQLLAEMQGQKASNEVFRETCEKALLQTKSVNVNVHDGIQQEIKETKADDSSDAVAGLVNTDGEVRNVKQNISNTSATGGSFAGAGIIQGRNFLPVSSSRK